MMRRRDLMTRALAACVAWQGLPALAQRTVRQYRIAYFSAGPAPPAHRQAALIDTLRGLGWVEGRDFIFERRFADNRPEMLTRLAAELADSKVDVIVTIGTLAPLALKRLKTSIPIVLAPAGDPVGNGLVEDLARPGGNITGLTLNAAEVVGRRVQLLKEAFPPLLHLAVLWNSTNPYANLEMKETDRSARSLGIDVLPFGVGNGEELIAALQAARQMKAQALFAVEDLLVSGQSTPIISFAATHRLPTSFGLRPYVEAGGLMSYGADLSEMSRRAASYVDKILKGAKAGELPVEQPTKFELVINMRTARLLDLPIPTALLLLADDVIQ